MDWYHRTQRQVGAEGIDAVRGWLSEAVANQPDRRPPWAHALSIAVLLATLLAVLVLAPGLPAAAAPLPPGDYQVALGAGDVWITVAPDGSATVAADDGLVAVLSFDAAGRALDEFAVASPEGLHHVEVEAAAGGHRIETTLVDRARSGPATGAEELTGTVLAQAAAASELRELVLVVAGCAPRGHQARVSGWPNHGTIVSRAASGQPLSAAVTDPATGATTRIDARLTTTEDAVAFCTLVADLAAGPLPVSDGARSGRDPASGAGTTSGKGAVPPHVPKGGQHEPGSRAGNAGQPGHETGQPDHETDLPDGNPGRSDRSTGDPAPGDGTTPDGAGGDDLPATPSTDRGQPSADTTGTPGAGPDRPSEAASGPPTPEGRQ